MRGVRTRRRISLTRRAFLVRKWNAREPMTLQELSEVLGVSRERVRQIEEKAMSKIRSVMGVVR